MTLFMGGLLVVTIRMILILLWISTAVLAMNPFAQTPYLFDTGDLIIDGDLIINSETFSLQSLIMQGKKAILWEDWIAFGDYTNNWGPRGGNVFIEVTNSYISYKEIQEPWSNRKKLLSEFAIKLPKSLDLHEYRIKYHVIDFYNNELWLTLTNYANFDGGDITPSPFMLVRMNIIDEQARFYSSNNFNTLIADAKLPYVVDIAFVDEHIIIVGMQQGFFYKQPDTKTLEAVKKNIVAYRYNPERDAFTQITVTNLKWVNKSRYEK